MSHIEQTTDVFLFYHSATLQAATTDKMRQQNEAMPYANRVIPEPRGEAERIPAAVCPVASGRPTITGLFAK